jgi:hypothetical protein
MQYTPTGDEPPLPDKIGPFHTLHPLEELLSPADSSSNASAAWGVRTSVLKGICARDGQAYALRIICGKQVRAPGGRGLWGRLLLRLLLLLLLFVVLVPATAAML